MCGRIICLYVWWTVRSGEPCFDVHQGCSLSFLDINMRESESFQVCVHMHVQVVFVFLMGH